MLTIEKLLEAKRALDALGPMPPMMRGVPVVVSAAATGLPKLRAPHTDDMRAMADDLLVRCPPARVPAAYVVNDQIVMHPSLYANLKLSGPTPRRGGLWP